MSPVDLTSFADLIECKENDSFTSECEVAKSYIFRQINSIEYANSSLAQKTCELLCPTRSAFPLVYQIYAAALTFGSSIAVCEASFFTLSRVLTSDANKKNEACFFLLVFFWFKKKHFVFFVFNCYF